MALTNVQNKFLKEQLKNNPEFIAEYFSNIIDEGPTSKYETNVPYDTPGSRINIKDVVPPPNIMGIPPSRRRGNDFFVGGIDASNPIKGKLQPIDMNPDILASYGTGEWSPSSGKVTTPEWFKKVGDIFDLETSPTTGQGTLNDFIEHVLAHETGHGVSGLELYQPDTKKAERLSFTEFLTANKKQGKKFLKEFGTHPFDQEELFNRMKDIERLKREYPDSYEDHPLWDLYYNRAQKHFAMLTEQDWYKGRTLSKFKDYEEKIKPFVNKYFEKVEKKGRGISDINIAKADIGMPEHLTQTPRYESPRGGGADVMPVPKEQILPPSILSRRQPRKGNRRIGRMPIGTDTRNPWGRAQGGSIDKPLLGRNRDI